MKYRVVVPGKVQKEINKINKKNKIRIFASLVAIEKNPYLGKKMQGIYKGKWTFRAWPYRIIYEIKKQELIILIVHIGHRQGVYE